MELVIAAADSWPSLMEKRPLYRGLKAIQQNALSSVSIFTLPLSPTCGQSSLSTRSAGLLPACALGKWAKESKHTHTLYTQKKYCIYCMANTKNQEYTHDYLCNLYYALYEGVPTQTQSKLTVSTAICDLRARLHPPSFSFLHSLSSPIIPLFQGEQSPFINPPLTVTSVICPCHCSPSTLSIFNPHFLLFCSFHLNAFHPWQAVTSAWKHISICTLYFLSGQQSGNV